MRDEFIPVENLRKTNQLLGNFNIFVYLQPTNVLYSSIPTFPAAVYSYEVTMDRIIEDSTKIESLKNENYVGNNNKQLFNKNNSPIKSNTNTNSVPTKKKFYDNSGNPVYPFVWRDAGPVDNLEEFFGY